MGKKKLAAATITLTNSDLLTKPIIRVEAAATASQAAGTQPITISKTVKLSRRTCTSVTLYKRNSTFGRNCRITTSKTTTPTVTSVTLYTHTSHIGKNEAIKRPLLLICTDKGTSIGGGNDNDKAKGNLSKFPLNCPQTFMVKRRSHLLQTPPQKQKQKRKQSFQNFGKFCRKSGLQLQFQPQPFSCLSGWSRRDKGPGVCYNLKSFRQLWPVSAAFQTTVHNSKCRKMCCCIPLRTLSYFGAIIHMVLGIYCLYLLGAVSYALYSAEDAPDSTSRRYMGFLYMAYYAAFLPPGIFIFWGVQKKLRRFLVWPPLAFFLIQLYSIGLESTYGYRPQSVPEAIKKHSSVEDLKKLQMSFWIDVFVQTTITLAYLFMLFFYYREIGPESAPVQSRYAQYPYIAQTVAAVAAHQQHQQQQAAALALHRPQPQAGASGPPPTQPAPPPPNQTPQPPTQLPPHLSHLAIGSNQAVAYHPASVNSPPPTSIPVAISPAASGPIGVMNAGLPPSLPSRTSSANTVPQAGPSINLGALATLSYEQQQQILKFHQQQLMLQQQQQHQHQQHQQQQHIPHSSAIEQELQQQILQNFPTYAALLAANQPGKAPKY